MGIERDYLMRQLVMLIEIIQKIINYKTKGQLQDAEEEIKYFYSILNLELNIIDRSTESFLDFLVNEKKFTNSQIEMIAFVLKEQGELAEIPEQQMNFFKKAYFLLVKVDRESTAFSMDRQLKMAQLREFLR